MLQGKRDFLGQISDELPNEYKARKCHERECSWVSKPLHKQFVKQIDEGVKRNSCSGLKHGQVKKETKGLTLARQDQAVSVNAYITP